MATELFRKRMIQMYRETRDPDMFLSEMFTVRPENISSAEKVIIDVVREDEEISPVVSNLEGPTLNVANQWVTKEWTPPTISEGMPLDAAEFLKRQPGQTEYDATDTSYLSAIISKINSNFRRLEGKIRRNREWQASQILQTGKLTLVDENGADFYAVDFLPKSSHFLTATPWSPGGDPLSDIETIADLIRDNSLQEADKVILGTSSLEAFLSNTKVKERLDNRRMELGGIAPSQPSGGAGGKFQGFFHVGNYRMELWSYNGRGIIPGSTTKVPFVDPFSCIVLASSGRRDTVFGGVPRVAPVDPRFAGILPDRIPVPGATDFAPNIYASLNGKQLIQELESRPLLIPTAIDSFGNITTGS